MANVLDELGAFLVAESVVTAVGTDLFLGYMPATPDACLTLTLAGGRPPEGSFGTTGIKYEFPDVQVTARGVKDDDETPLALAISAQQKFAEIQAESLSSTQYRIVLPGAINDLTPDEKGRPRFFFIANIDKEKS